MLGRDTNATDVVALRHRLDRVETLLMNTLPRVASLEPWKSDRADDHKRIAAVELHFQRPQDLRNERWGHRHRIHEVEKRFGIQHAALETIEIATVPASVAVGLAEDQTMYDEEDGHPVSPREEPRKLS